MGLSADRQANASARASTGSTTSDRRYRRLQQLHSLLVVVHRYVGLAIALFLIVASLTGSVAVFKSELDAMLNPALFRIDPPAPGARLLDPLLLRELVERQLPAGVSVWEVRLTPPEAGRSVLFNLNWDGDDAQQPMDQAFADPYTGRVLGTRNHLDIREGLGNLIPFLFKLHYSLALDEVGAWLLGITAVLWTVDCFVALYLTFPKPQAATARLTSRRSWLLRWKPSWLVRGNSIFAAIFTFHRASGLWMWPLLLMFAWSSVALLMNPVYEPVTHLVFRSYKNDPYRPLAHPRPHPKLTWEQALAKGQAWMAAEAAKRGITIVRPFILSHEPSYGFYRYQVQSSLDPSNVWCDTVVRMDSDTGDLVGFDAPTGIENGRTFTTWLVYLHFGWVGGLPYRILICIVGLFTVVLSITGVIIWWRKRSGRVHLRRWKQIHARESRGVMP